MKYWEWKGHLKQEQEIYNQCLMSRHKLPSSLGRQLILFLNFFRALFQYYFRKPIWQCFILDHIFTLIHLHFTFSISSVKSSIKFDNKATSLTPKEWPRQNLSLQSISVRCWEDKWWELRQILIEQYLVCPIANSPS